ncbi:hypothetical protein PQX77_001409 [Marasmius sp. AFHP31]|nr:hypothetical protein PQX77_001409 [Marasmius sp. AFHP31]
MFLLGTSGYTWGLLKFTVFALGKCLLWFKDFSLRGLDIAAQKIKQSKAAEGHQQSLHPEARELSSELRTALLKELLKASPSPGQEASSIMMWLRGTQSWFRFHTRSREEEWRVLLKEQLKPTFDEFTDAIADKMTTSLHEWLPEIHPEPPKFDTILGMLLTHTRIKLDLQPMIKAVMADMENMWVKVLEPVKEARRQELVKDWLSNVVDPEMKAMMDRLTYPNTRGDYRKISRDVSKASILKHQNTSDGISTETSIYDDSLTEEGVIHKSPEDWDERGPAARSPSFGGASGSGRTADTPLLDKSSSQKALGFGLPTQRRSRHPSRSIPSQSTPPRKGKGRIVSSSVSRNAEFFSGLFNASR